MKRKDGVRVTSEAPMYYLIPHILTKRVDSMNMCTVDIPLEPLRKYMNEKRKEGVHISHLALILSAYLRAIDKFPALNRFIVNKKIYQRNEVCASMVVLRPGHDNDTMSKIYFEPHTDTLMDVQKKTDDYINGTREENSSNSLDSLMAAIMKFDFLVGGICNIIRWADRHGLLPKAVIDASPFHASFLITNLASIRTNHIYHHVYEFGTTSIAIAMGNMRDVTHIARDGSMTAERCIPLGLVMDERICSGHYFAQVFAYIKELLADPRKMETSIAEEEALAAAKS
ncbi:MAG: 2-oxo acid dehydrogenase subunit E2 [Firmicutes bacterium]|nr:2-oxo acid dehydrogenase subunit E2 [Bacillota bacterium]